MTTAKPTVRSETAYTYTNKYIDKEINFTPKTDEIVATFQPDASHDTPHDVMAASAMAISQSADPERGFAVFQVAPDQDLETAGQALGQQPQVANTLPAMVDDEGLTRYFLPDEFTVQFDEDISAERAAEILNTEGSTMVAAQRTPGYYTVRVPENKGLFETLQAISQYDEVEFAEPSEVGFNDELYVPNDPAFVSLWGLQNTGQTVNGLAGRRDADIDATLAWNITQGDRDVVVAVIDTGADMDHPDLRNNYLPRGSEDWDFADNNDPVPEDGHGHGTHVAGTAAAVDNTKGIIGVAPRCRIMPLRVNLTAGMNQNRADAINYVAAQAVLHRDRRYVINCSWRMSGNHAGVRRSIIRAVNRNVVVVFAAGNANRNIDVLPQYPAVYPEVIAVAATDPRDQRASFSNYGKKVDVAAPGVNIYSTYPNDGYAFLNGTSMAAPHVAGLAALIWSRNATLSNHQVRAIVESTCDNIDARNPGFAGLLGKGRINAYRALRATPLPPVQFKLGQRIKFPQKNRGSSTGLAFARRFRVGFFYRSVLMFLTQQPGSERIYYLSPYSGKVLGSIDPQNNNTIGSLEWDGRNIRVANVTTGAGFINTISPFTGAQSASLPVPPGRGEGMAYDGKYLYYSTITRIHVVNPSSGAVVRSFPAPGGACRSLTYGRGYLFSGNSATGVITVFDRSTLAIRGTIAAPGSGSAKVEGLAFNPYTNDLFIANQSENIIYVGEVTL